MNNRLIKFRVWDKKAKAFLQEEDGLNPLPDGICFNIITGKFDACSSELLKRTEYYILQQFTGLYDKNKYPIYEGDIVKYTYERYEFEFENDIGEVFFEDGIFYIGKEARFASNDCNLRKEFIEIVGTVFENPNLLSLLKE